MAAPKAIKQIVVGLDGSPHSAAALEMAIDMANGMGSRITAVYAVDLPAQYPELQLTPLQFDDGWRKTMKAEFEEEWCAPLREAHVPYRAMMREGRAPSVILRIAEAQRAELIVVGRRGRSALTELLLGSVSRALVLNSKIPVLVVEPDPTKNLKGGRRAA